MHPKVRQAISDLLGLSAEASGYRWIAVLSDKSPEPVIYPPEDQEKIEPYLQEKQALIGPSADIPASPGATILVEETGPEQLAAEDPTPAFLAAIGLFDSSGKRQGSLIALDAFPKSLNEKQQQAVARIARLTERHIEAGALEDLNQRLETQNSQVALLSEVARQINNGVVITDENGLITWINRGFEKISGYRRHELIGKTPGSMLQGEQTDPDTIAYMRRQLAKREPFTVEVINYRSNGTPYWIRIQCQPLEAGTRVEKGFIAIQTDINAEKANQKKFEHSLRLNRAILETLYDAVITTDIRGTIRTVNPALEAMFGYPEENLIGQPITKLMPPEVAGHHGDSMQTYADGLAGAGEIMGNARMLQGIRSDGSRFPLRIAVTETTVNSERLLIAALHDITDSEDAKADLQRFRKTLDSTLDCVFMFDAQTLQFFYVNNGSVNQLGYSRKELLEMHPFDIKPQFPEENFRKLIEPLIRGEVPKFNFETVHRHKEGHDIPVNVSLQYVTLEAEPPRFIAIVRDISEQQRHKAEIEHLAYFDPLTNLPNRRLIRQKLEDSMTVSVETGCFGAVMLSDLDDFKNINDTLGHRCGDDLLVEISNRFAEVLGDRMALARLGGDEFLVVLNTRHADRNSAINEVTATARQLLKAAIEPTEALHSARPISTSIGIVLYKDTSCPISEIMRMADIAMYDAKNKGKNSYSLFDDIMQKHLLEEQSLAVELNAALSLDDEIVPWFQPKVDQNGLWVGFEALARWEHPHLGLLSPDRFIDLAEKNNLMIQLGDQILRHSCHRMNQWRQEFGIIDWTVSVNISQSQLGMRDFPEKVQRILSESRLPAGALVLEITESVVAENILHSIRQMEQLTAIGVRFSLDDFGTGYSSLSYLRELPIDELKIDRSFIESLLHDEEGPAIVKAILSLAHGLKLSVVAEGIEERDQWQALQTMGCECFQGYFFSRPQPSEQIQQALEQGTHQLRP